MFKFDKILLLCVYYRKTKREVEKMLFKRVLEIAALALLAVAILMVLHTCGKSPSHNNISNITNPTQETLEQAPKQLSVNGSALTLTTYLWRDFMPMSPPDGKPMIAVATISTTDSTVFPATIKADRMWIINGDQVWNTEFTNENQPPTDSILIKKVARDGPKWGPGVDVTVVVRLVDGQGETMLLKAENQPIHRTD